MNIQELREERESLIEKASFLVGRIKQGNIGKKDSKIFYPAYDRVEQEIEEIDALIAEVEFHQSVERMES